MPCPNAMLGNRPRHPPLCHPERGPMCGPTRDLQFLQRMTTNCRFLAPLGMTTRCVTPTQTTRNSPRNNAQSTANESQLAFLHSANAAAVESVVAAIEAQVERLLPEGVAKNARTRVVGEIYRELDSSLRSNPQFAAQLRDAFRSGSLDDGHQRAIVSLLTGRARPPRRSQTRAQRMDLHHRQRRKRTPHPSAHSRTSHRHSRLQRGRERRPQIHVATRPGLRPPNRRRHFEFVIRPLPTQSPLVAQALLPVRCSLRRNPSILAFARTRTQESQEDRPAYRRQAEACPTKSESQFSSVGLQRK